MKKVDFNALKVFSIFFGLNLLIVILSLQTTPWAKDLFSTVCHQDPLRSFTNQAGLSLAVCSRCLGFYLALCCNWLLVSFVFMKLRKIEVLYMFLFCWALNILDVLFNQLGFWQNTLESRFFGGILLAFPIAFLFSDELAVLKPFNSKSPIYERQ